MLTLLSSLAAASLLIATVAGTTAAQSAGPADWPATERTVRDLVYGDRHADAIALLVPVAKAHPRFADAQAWLGTAYESMGRAQAASNPMAALTTLDTAVGHFQRALDLGGGTMPEVTVPALVDLLALLRKDTERRSAIAAGVARFPALPVVHRYAVALALDDGADVAPALRTARAGIPAADVRGRLDHADSLARLVETAPAAAQAALVAEVQALCDAALKARPGDRRVADDVRRVRGQLAIATTPVDRSRGPAANEAGVQGALRAIVSAQAAYSATCGAGFYAATLDVLGRPPADGSTPYLPADLVPPQGGRVLERYGYVIAVTATPDTAAPRSCNGAAAGTSSRSYAVIARPMAGRSGRAFRIDQDGTMTAIQ